MTIPRNISFLAEGASSTGVLSTAFGGTGVANNAASTVTISGNFGTTLTVTGTTAVTLPTSGTLITNSVTTLSSLVSVGTIATGVWNGSLITGTYGGTGVNNGASIITLAGNLTTSGANALTLTTTGTTNVTLPTSGTLSTVALSGTNTWTGTQSFTGSSSVLAGSITNIVEPITVSATAATGTIALYPSTQSILYYTLSASANFTINITFSAGTTLNTAMTTGQAITVVFMNTNGASAFYNSTVQVDSTTSGVTTKWQGGTAPTSGNASSVDVYTYTIIKTGSAAFTVLASQTKFA
jgi:hypothetical protein